MSRRRIVAVIGLVGVLGATGVVLSLAATPDPDLTAARASANAFLDRYLDPDGRVVRRDQGGDTVSEGQAYAMLLTVALGDRQRFALVWRWTRANLQRDDGLLSWHWADGDVLDPQSATDADLDTVRALLLAARRFDAPRYRAQALRIASSILRQETLVVAGRRVLVAGPWAAQTPAWVNPSYVSPVTFAMVYRATGDPAWRGLARSSLRLLDDLTDAAPHLPPDWAEVDASGAVSPAGPPGGGGSPQYGPDAVRVPVRMAEDCSAGGRAIAARIWPFLQRAAEGQIVMAYDLSGDPVTDAVNAIDWVAAAGAARAAGEDPAPLLDRAEGVDASTPTYYGAAWIALGRITLTTHLLGGCGAR